jgi:hypothetical protein
VAFQLFFPLPAVLGASMRRSDDPVATSAWVNMGLMLSAALAASAVALPIVLARQAIISSTQLGMILGSNALLVIGGAAFVRTREDDDGGGWSSV